jgi:hypothetical protein
MLSRSFAHDIGGMVRALVVDDVDVQWAGIVLCEQGLNWLCDDIGLIAGGNDDSDAGMHSGCLKVPTHRQTWDMPEMPSRCDQVNPYDAGKRGDGEWNHGFASGWTSILQCTGKIPAQAKLERGTPASHLLARILRINLLAA